MRFQEMVSGFAVASMVSIFCGLTVQAADWQPVATARLEDYQRAASDALNGKQFICTRADKTPIPVDVSHLQNLVRNSQRAFVAADQAQPVLLYVHTAGELTNLVGSQETRTTVSMTTTPDYKDLLALTYRRVKQTTVSANVGNLKEPKYEIQVNSVETLAFDCVLKP